MTLIEVILTYRRYIRALGRQKADEWLGGAGLPGNLYQLIQASFNDVGMPIDREGRTSKVTWS